MLPASTTPSETSLALLTPTLATVWFTLFLDLVAFGMILPVLPHYATHFGASPKLVTLLSTTFSAAQFVMSPVLGRVSDRYGRRRVMLLSVSGSIAAMLVLTFAGSLVMVFAARLISGMCNANISTAHAYVADRVVPTQRAKYMGIMGSAIGLGFIFGPTLGGLLATDVDPSRPFLFAAGLGAINLLMAWKWLPESLPRATSIDHAGPAIAGEQAGRRAFSLRTPLFWLILTNFGFFFAFAAMESSFALYTHARFVWGAKETGYFFTYVGVVIALFQGLVVGWSVKHLGERRTLYVGMVLLSLGLLQCAFATQWFVLVGAGLCIAGGNGLINPSIGALVSRNVSARQQGTAMGLSQSAASLARITGPILAGLLFETWGEGTPMLLGGCVMIVNLLVGFVTIRDAK